MMFFIHFFSSTIAERCLSETEKFILEDIFSVQYCYNLEKYNPSENLRINNFSIFQSLKLRILMKNPFNFS